MSLVISRPPTVGDLSVSTPPDGIPLWPAEWPAPLLRGQVVCTSDVDNVTAACCAKYGGALWIPDDNWAADHNGDHQNFCLLFADKDGSNSTWKAYLDCEFDSKPEHVRIGACVYGSGAWRRVTVGLGMMAWVVAGCVLSL